MNKRIATLSWSFVLVAASCASDSAPSQGDSTSPVTATTSTAAPAPTSPVTTVAAPPTVAVETTMGAQTPTTLGPVSSGPATTNTPNGTSPNGTSSNDTTPNGTTDVTVAATTTTASGPTSSDPGEGVDRRYLPVPSPVVPSATEPVVAAESQPDGIYYASVSEAAEPAGPPRSVLFEVVQLFTGAACVAHFGDADDDACINDYGVETDPTSSIEIALDDQFISVVDAATQQSYQISGAELSDLILGSVPSSEAPPDYVYSGFGFLVTYRGGSVTRLEQWWTP